MFITASLIAEVSQINQSIKLVSFRKYSQVLFKRSGKYQTGELIVCTIAGRTMLRLAFHKWHIIVVAPELRVCFESASKCGKSSLRR